MALKCDRCGKGTQRGSQIARARQGLNYRSPKVFKPNLHTARVVVDGKKVKMQLCTKCLRIVKKDAQKQWQKEQVEKAKTAKSPKKNIDKPKKVEKKEKPTRKAARKERQKEKEAEDQKAGERLKKRVVKKQKSSKKEK